jgi:hypothetical protein
LFQLSAPSDFSWFAIPFFFGFNLETLPFLYSISKCKIPQNLARFEYSFPNSIRNDQYYPVDVWKAGNSTHYTFGSRKIPNKEWTLADPIHLFGVDLPRHITLLAQKITLLDGKAVVKPAGLVSYALVSHSERAGEIPDWRTKVQEGDQVQKATHGQAYTVIANSRLGSIDHQMEVQESNWKAHDKVVAFREANLDLRKKAFITGGVLLAFAVLLLAWRKKPK